MTTGTIIRHKPAPRWIRDTETDRPAILAPGGGWLLIPLPPPRGGHLLVDLADADLARRRWCLTGAGYAHGFNRDTHERELLHRLIAARMFGPLPPDRRVDHISRDRLDNRRGNIRLASCSQSAINTSNRRGTSSGFRGVSWDRARGRYRAYITVAGKRVALGRFDSEDAAAEAYDRMARASHGEFAMLNFPDEGAAERGS